MDQRSNMHNTLKSMPRFSGGEDACYREWRSKIRMAVSYHKKDYDYVRKTSFRERDFGLDDIKSTMTNMFIDSLSRSSTKSVAGRGVAMQVTSDSSGIKCFNGRKDGHLRSGCPEPQRPKPQQQQQKGGKKKHWKKGSGGEPSPKWCSFHKTKTHSDAECLKQKEARDKQAGSVNFPNIGSGRIAQLEQPEQEEECTFGFSFTSVGASSAAPVADTGPKPENQSSLSDQHRARCSSGRQLTVQDCSQLSERHSWRHHLWSS